VRETFASNFLSSFLLLSPSFSPSLLLDIDSFYQRNSNKTSIPTSCTPFTSSLFFPIFLPPLPSLPFLVRRTNKTVIRFASSIGPFSSPPPFPLLSPPFSSLSRNLPSSPEIHIDVRPGGFQLSPPPSAPPPPFSSSGKRSFDVASTMQIAHGPRLRQSHVTTRFSSSPIPPPPLANSPSPPSLPQLKILDTIN